ncbi:unnamed protein product [marine sediment metagenome]|uniref:Uncharacterized protein n=1 Tax=marine sediment metagenome TaxID=412755 RepID=X0SDF5_9ZZZZ
MTRNLSAPPPPKKPQLPFEKLIPIEGRQDAINALARFTPEVLLDHPNESRHELVQYLTQKVSEQGVSVPPFWNNILAQPGKYNDEHNDRNSGISLPEDMLANPADFDSRPTQDAEELILNLPI